MVYPMDSIQITGIVDHQHRLTAEVPPGIGPGPVTIWLSQQALEDDAGCDWVSGIAKDWAVELGDEREDIYTISDGDPID